MIWRYLDTGEDFVGSQNGVSPNIYSGTDNCFVYVDKENKKGLVFDKDGNRISDEPVKIVTMYPGWDGVVTGIVPCEESGQSVRLYLRTGPIGTDQPSFDNGTDLTPAVIVIAGVTVLLTVVLIVLIVKKKKAQ